MPKQVDHEARRQRIADAVCRVAARQGLEGVSLRHVAAEAGISMGQVQHYFTTKDEMLLFAFRTLSARVERRLGETMRAPGRRASTRDQLRAVLAAMVAVDDAGRTEAPLWVAFLARAVVAPALAEPLRDDALVTFAADRLRAAQRAGEVAASVDPDLEARSLFALADGLMIRAMLDPDGAESALRIIDYRLDLLFGSHTPAGAAETGAVR